jgi:phosphinothricin acetyltransferase
VLSSHVTFDVEPFTVEGRREWLARYADVGPFRLLVAETVGAVQGYATSSPFRGRAAYRTSVETSVYCRPDSTGRGVGTLLYGHLFDQLAGQGLHRAYAGITVPNGPSLALHRRFGFREIGTFGEVGHKFDRYWDVLWLEKSL